MDDHLDVVEHGVWTGAGCSLHGIEGIIGIEGLVAVL